MLLKFLLFCFICYTLFRVLNFVLRIGRVVSTQKQAFEHVQNEFKRRTNGATSNSRQRVGDVFIDHVPVKEDEDRPSATGRSGEYVDYEEVKD